MAVWVSQRRKWDASIAKRAAMGRALTPAGAKAYQSFLDNPFRKLVFDVKNQCHIPRASSATNLTLKSCVVAELKMSLDPAHLSLRLGNGPFCHLFVRQFEVTEEQASGKAIYNKKVWL